MPHTNLCSCRLCHTHQPCYTQGASGLDGKPGARVSQHLNLLQHALWLWVLRFRTDSRHMMRSPRDWSGRRRWTKRVAKKGRSRERIDTQPTLQNIFWRLGSGPDNLQHGKNDQSDWLHCLTIPDRFFHKQWTHPAIPCERSLEGIKITWNHFNLLSSFMFMSVLEM